MRIGIGGFINDMKKAIIILVIILIMMILGYGLIRWIMPILYLGGIFPPAPSYKQMDRYLTENIQELSCIAEYLSQFDYDNISIRKDNVVSKTMSAYSIEYMPDTDIKTGSNHFNLPITEVKVLDAIEKLFEHGFDYIGKDRNEYLDFSKWSALDRGKGIAYSLNGYAPVNLYAVIDLKSLSIENWYYYESNYDKWKEDK